MFEISDDAVEAADIWGGQISADHIREMLTNALPHILGPILTDLRSRNVKAVQELSAMALDSGGGPEKQRLIGKVDGVQLGVSYLDEITRGL